MTKLMGFGVLVLFGAVVANGVWSMFPNNEKIKLVASYICGTALALTATGYAVCKGMAPLTWDFPTRLSVAGWCYPLWAWLGQKFERYKVPVFWALCVVFGILFALTAFKS